MPTTLPKPGKAAKRLKASEINYLIETGEMSDALARYLQTWIDESEASEDGEVQVVLFIENDADEQDELSEDN